MPRSILLLLLALGCGERAGAVALTRAELLDPGTCKDCHPDHYREWSGSMHAYAADDPVFIAMNQRGQRETNGELGDFCVRCHAPMAVREGATADGLNLAEVPQQLKGVTCYFCHSAASVLGSHNNPIELAEDGVMRGGIPNPATDRAPHGVAYSQLHARNQDESSTLCGACHDIVTPAGVHLERTFEEWKTTIFATAETAAARNTCSECHMKIRTGVAAMVEGVPLRTLTEHTFAGIDVALTPWPEMEAQRAAVARDLDPAILGRVCVNRLEVDVHIDNILAGHMFPSGAAQDRRAWIELIAYKSDGTIHYQSGVRADDEPVLGHADDPDLWVLRDRLFDENDRETHMFWRARRYESELAPPAVTNDPTDPRYYHAITKQYILPPGEIDRVTMRLRIRPMGLDVLDDLISSGDLAPAVRDQMVTLTARGTERTWTLADQGHGECSPRF